MTLGTLAEIAPTRNGNTFSPGQRAELAAVCVLLAADEGGDISAARIAVTGGRPSLSAALSAYTSGRRCVT
jgi:hypothetical protein